MAQEKVMAVVTSNPEKGIEEAMAEITYNFPDTVADYVNAYGEEVVKSLVYQKTKIAIQAGMRLALRSGKNQDAIQEWANNWRPGLAKPKKSQLEKALQASQNMSEGELNELLKAIKARRSS